MKNTAWNCTNCNHLQNDTKVCEICNFPNPYFIPHPKKETILPDTHFAEPAQKKVFIHSWNDNHELPENWESSID